MIQDRKSNHEKKILIVGAGSFSTEIEELARLVGYQEFAFIDDRVSLYSKPIIGCMDDIGKLRSQYDSAIVALGKNEDRRFFHEKLKLYHYSIPSLIHPTAFVSPEAVLSPGCIIRAHAVISRYTKLGEGVIVNVGGLIDHHCEIGAFSHILMGAVVRNSRKIEPLAWIEANVVVE